MSIEKGNQYSDEGRYKEAEKEYRKATRENPKSEGSWHNLGNALFNQSQYQEAEQAFLKALDLDPKYVDAWNGLGVALNVLGRYKEAEQAFRKALDLDPKYVHAWNGLGNALSDQKEYQEGEQAYRKALDLDPKFVHVWYNLGNTLNDQKQYQEAEKNYRKTLGLDPTFADAWYNLACLHAIQNKTESALENLRHVIHLEGDEAIKTAKTDKDFDNIRNHPVFQKLIGIDSGQADEKAPNERPPKVFLCHAHEDKVQVLKIREKLEAQGIKTWIDKINLLPGQKWKKEIPKALKTCDFALVFLSQTSVAKKGYVQREFKLAIDFMEDLPDDQVFLIPAKLDDCEVPSLFHDYHWAPLYEPDGFDKILQAIRTSNHHRSSPYLAPQNFDQSVSPKAPILISIGERTLPVYPQTLDIVYERIESKDSNRVITSKDEVLKIAEEFGLTEPTEPNIHLKFRRGDVAYWVEEKETERVLWLEFAARRVVLDNACREGIIIQGQGELSRAAQSIMVKILAGHD